MHPDSARLAFRETSPDDLDDMACLLGDPGVMTYYPRPKTRQEAAQWIQWNRGLYRTHGFGLWLLTTADGDFVGDCGLTPQVVDGVTELEVGYHIVPARQGRGYATEAAAASRDFARTQLGAPRLVAIIDPDNRRARSSPGAGGWAQPRPGWRGRCIRGRRSHCTDCCSRPARSC
jgi:RimJ/RimL family protein N-acetyltransferase